MQFVKSNEYDWRQYIAILRHLRLTSLTNLLQIIKLLHGDNLIPVALLDWVMRDQWKTMLLNEEATTP